jgi:hypothetical protein
MYEIIKPIKERVRFLTEHRVLFQDTLRNDSNQISSEKYINNLSDNKSQQVVEEQNINQFPTQSIITLSNNHQVNASVFDSSTNSESEVMHDETIISTKEDENKESDEDEEESTFPHIYDLPNLPSKIEQIIDTGEINQFRGHTNARRLLIDAIFDDVTTNYSLL